jgi:hypothetical protein
MKFNAIEFLYLCAIFPYDLWDDDKQPAQAVTAPKATTATVKAPSAPTTQPSPIPEGGEQLGLAV